MHFSPILYKYVGCGVLLVLDIEADVFLTTLLSGVQLLHHLVSMISLMLAVHSGHAHLYLYIVLLSECTTPFINLRWYYTSPLFLIILQYYICVILNYLT